MIFDPPLPRGGEVAIVGLGRSGLAAAELLRKGGVEVYISDASSSVAVLEAAGRARSFGAEAQAGDHDLARIARASLLVASPGISPAAPALVAAAESGVPVASEVEIALRALKGTRYIAVTGTNGKSTTTALIAHLLRSFGANAVEAGNIGTPLSAIALANSPPEWVALEMSSFQLHDTPSIAPSVGVLTNLAPDHLDRYASVQEYYADKALLFRNASSDSCWVINGDDPEVVRMTERVAGKSCRFSLGSAGDATLLGDGADAQLALFKTPVIRRSELPLLGDHNVGNVLAALLAVCLADRRFEDAAHLAEAVRTFRGLPHRLEIVAERGGVLWINDSKATNVSSTLVAVQSMTRPFILLLGGRHKGESYTALIAAMAGRARKVIAYGESADLILEDLKSAVDVERAGNDFDGVIDTAKKIARPGEAVLLSPACSSYDMFRSFEERGDRFRALAAGLK